MYNHKDAYYRKMKNYIGNFGKKIIVVVNKKLETSEYVGFEIMGTKSSTMRTYKDVKKDYTEEVRVTQVKFLWEDFNKYLAKLNIVFGELKDKIIEISIDGEKFHLYDYYLNSFDNILVMDLKNIK